MPGVPGVPGGPGGPGSIEGDEVGTAPPVGAQRVNCSRR
ncbi:hypothetical protein KCH_03640 [Kitasatospora cheerisanensis KCTC 2395]|uniref:Uncharacterized protein n=1 Tax=Kitasatospora cheerisanensis KCTC 2395 TaxID=1348663 RepID=A0A066Z2M8_9ACTN|nr:hypothetical protein KCH_03640 [Kitasatospora cheerisanensis KCTC 2395]